MLAVVHQLEQDVAPPQLGARSFFPSVGVDKKADKYYVYTRADLLRSQAQRRGPSAEIAIGSYGVSDDSYECENWALGRDIDDPTRANAESLAALKPAFDTAGNITAGNASQISDGGAAVVVASKEAAERLGGSPLGEIVAYGQVAGPDPSLLTQPSRSIKQALERANLQVSDVDLFELNEAFAAVGLASMQDLGISDDVVNVNGGAIALGHPVGMSGTRVALTLLHELKRRGGGLGAAALCGGGGQGDAFLLSVSNN